MKSLNDYMLYPKTKRNTSQLLHRLYPDISKKFLYRRLTSEDGADVHIRVLDSKPDYRIMIIGQYMSDGFDVVTLNEFTFLMDHNSIALIAFNDRTYRFSLLHPSPFRGKNMIKDLETYFQTWLQTLLSKNYQAQSDSLSI